jgi:nucleotide-binding universal stress UspA family protein
LLFNAAMTTPANTWILGLDLGGRSRGAVCLANWLAGPEHTLAVHVLELWSRPYIRTDAVSTTREVVSRLASELHIPPPTHATVMEAETAEAGLARAAEGAAGLVIGRAAGHAERMMWALGHVARRVLRSLPCPVVVVPRDLTAVAPGPIVLATDLDDATNAAVGFARELASKHGRELVVAHVVEDRYSDLIDPMDPHWQRARDIDCQEREQSAHRWMAEHGLIGRPRIAQGSVVDELNQLATATHAAMVVVGSRRLGTVGRFFLGSTASTLAAQAPCPVAVVPST